MNTKFKRLPGFLTENELAVRLRDSAQQIWLAGLGVYGVAQVEGGKVLGALVKEGETVQARALKLTNEKMAIVAGKASDTLDRVEHVLDDGVARTLDRFGVVTKRDINTLSKNVHDLTVIVEKFAKREAAPPSVGDPISMAPRIVTKPERTMTERV